MICTCRDPMALGVVHRADAPCYIPEQRTWRWLTDKEIYEAWDTIIEEPKQAIQFAYNIQSKLKEKNNAA